MPFIDTVSAEDASGPTKELYDKATEMVGGFLPNWARPFSHRPEVCNAWFGLLQSIKANIDERRYELITLAAAQEMQNSYCMLAHGTILMREHYSADQLQQIVAMSPDSKLNETDKAIMEFARKVVRDATSVTQSDVDRLKGLSLSDADVMDIVCTAAARCFFSKTSDALGVLPDVSFLETDSKVRESLAIGRPIENAE